MGNFGRAISLALHYRWSLFVGVACSLVVAVLWGGNIGAVYPFVEVIFRGQSLRDWVDQRIPESNQAIAKIEAKIQDLDRRSEKADDEEQNRLGLQKSYEESALAAERQSLAWLEWARPHIHAWLPSGPFESLVVIVAALFVGSLVKDFFLAMNMIFVDRLANLAIFDLRKEFFRRTLRMDLATFGNDRTGPLLSRFTNDIEALRMGLSNLFGASVREPLKALACLVGAAYICWPLLVVSLVVTPLAAIAIHLLTAAIRRATKKAMEEMSGLYSLLGEIFHGIETVKANARERQERRRFHRQSKECFYRQMRIVLYNALTKPATEVMGIAVICLAILAGAYLVLTGERHLFGIWMTDRPLSLGALMVFYGMLAGAADPVRRMSEVWVFVQRGAVAADRVYEMLDREPVVADPENPVALPETFEEIRFEGVSFRYDEEKPVLSEIDLKFRNDETVAIVGPNGCGKSTLMKLLLRFMDPTDGKITIDGVDIREVRQRDLRGLVGVVSQQTFLFDDTVRENIRYGAPGASDEEVEEAARHAHAHEFILEKLADGYDTIVGQGGNRLSGGQRQRIALARAILRDPRILVLDEATSQVDLESEHLIHQALEEFVQNRLTLIVTHRLSTLALADRILVLDAGEILDIGTHEELIARCSLYRQLHERQFSKAA